MEVEKYEEQRYGRNKSTQINHAYINGGEYRKKFDYITDNPKLNKVLYQLAKKMLKHRSGTLYEDMYWINPITCEVVAREICSSLEEQIDYSNSTERIISEYSNLITIHTHPNSFPPSPEDFNSNYMHKYGLGIVCCHNGKAFVYNASEITDVRLFLAFVQSNKMDGMDEFDAQWEAIKLIEQNVDIQVKVVFSVE